ncbi:hypothetical protein QQ045_021593 [Rhodiola kirilowii]
MVPHSTSITWDSDSRISTSLIGAKVEDGEVFMETLGQASSVRCRLRGSLLLRVSFPEKEWADAPEDWAWSWVGLVFGSQSLLGKIQGFIRSQWGNKQMVAVSQFKSGIFLFKFTSEEERDRIMDLGHWSIDSQALVFRHWSPDMNYALKSVVSLLMWARSPELAPYMQQEDMLSKLASSLGRLFRTYGFTSQKEKLMHAIVSVEDFTSNEFKKSVVIKGSRGVNFVQKIV